MMQHLEHIDDYFSGKLPAEQKEQFEGQIVNDRAFAEEVAFYVATMRAAGAQAAAHKKKRFWELYRQGKPAKVLSLKRWWPYVAAAVITGVVIGVYLYTKPTSPKQLADQYMQQNFQSAGVTMGTREDSLQAALRLYNENKLPEALQQFEIIARSEAGSFEGKKYAGIVSLRLQQYDKALTYFQELANLPGFYNPGVFYQAITLMERNLPGDKAKSRELLQQVVEKDLEGKDIAAGWLKKWQD